MRWVILQLNFPGPLKYCLAKNMARDVVRINTRIKHQFA